MDLVISTIHLNAMFKKFRKRDKIEELLVVDTRPFSKYSAGHVPGAVNVDLMQFHWIDTSSRGISQFNRQASLLLSNIGVKPNIFTVFYDDISGASAARGVWLLLYFSHTKVALLDGGFRKWKKDRFAVELKPNSFIHTAFKGRPNTKILATFDQVKSWLPKRNHVIVDARSKPEFDGTLIRAAKGGHIPTAVNINWTSNIERTVFKKFKKLQQIYKPPKDAKIVTYCQGGFRAANSFVVLKMLGFKNVRMYLGSWGEWGNRSDAPSEPRKR